MPARKKPQTLIPTEEAVATPVQAEAVAASVPETPSGLEDHLGNPVPPLARTPKPRRPAAAKPVAPADVSLVAAPSVADPLQQEVPFTEPATNLPAFLRDRAARPVLPAVRILGEEAAARPTGAAAAAPVRPAEAAPPPATGDGPYSVYVLGDDAGTIHYVGISDNVERRVAQHLNAACNPRSRWIQALTAAGAKPRYKVVETVPTRAAALAAERRWIGHYRTAGHPLTNGRVPPERHPALDEPVAAPAAAPALHPPAAAHPPELPTRHRNLRPWLTALVACLIGVSLLGVGLGRVGAGLGAPTSALPHPTNNRGSVPRDTAAAQPVPTGVPVDPGALAATATAVPQRVGSHAVQVQPGQTLADVAALLDLTPDALAVQLGRDTVYAGETVVRDLYDGGDPDATALSQGGADPTATVDIYNGKGPDAPIAPVVDMTVLASTGLCPPGTARAGQPRDGRVVVPFEPGCAPEDRGQLGPQRQAWVEEPPTPDVQGDRPPALLPATGMSGEIPQAAALGETVAEGVAGAAPTPPVEYCADGSVRDLTQRTKAPFVPGCAPLEHGPVPP